MNIKLPIIASLTAIVFAQGGCYESAMRNNPVITITFESQDTNGDVPLETEAPMPSPTFADVELPSDSVNMPDDPVAVHQGTHTYSVETTNVGTCICPVRAGEVEVTLVFKGDNLEIPNFMGEPLSFTKVDENRYEYRYMMEKSTGPEEAMKVITTFDWGYKEEFYINNSSKLCCVYDYLCLDK